MVLSYDYSNQNRRRWGTNAPPSQAILMAIAVCVFWASGSRGSLVITRYQSLPLTPGKVLPVCVTQ